MKNMLRKTVGVMLLLLILFSPFTACVNDNTDANHPSGDAGENQPNGDENSNTPTETPDVNQPSENDEHIHTFSSKFDENEHYMECACGEITDRTEHTFDWVTDIEPTYTTPGVKHKECACGKVIEENTVSDRLIHSEEVTDGIVDPSLFTYKSFANLTDLNVFCDQHSKMLEGTFLCLDLSYAKEDKIHVQTGLSSDIYAFDYKEEKDNKYYDSKLTTHYSFYSEELGTDTDIYMDVPYHSMTLDFISLPQNSIEEDLQYEFYRYSDEKMIWNHLIKIYSGENCIAYIYYYTGLDISREWVVSFLNEYITLVNN